MWSHRISKSVQRCGWGLGVCVLALALPASAQPVYETSTAPQATVFNAAGGTNNVTCGMGSGANRLALVAVNWRNRTNDITGVTINGTSMTSAGTIVTSGANADAGRLFYLAAPTSGSQTVAVTYTASDGPNSIAQVSCWVANNVDQTTPVENYNSGSGSGSSANIVSSVTVTSEANDLVPVFHSTYNTSEILTATPTGYTERQDADDASGMAAEFGDQAGASSVATSATWSNTAITVSWVALGISVNPVAGGSACVPTMTLLGVGQCG